MTPVELYRCDKCKEMFSTRYEASKHEANCMGISFDVYQKWEKLCSAVNRTYNKFLRYSSISNRENYEKASDELKKFEELHSFKSDMRPLHFKETD